ncbi:AMP-binding protein [Bacillus pfraonensis]|uniref:condensation domain-containing protein n=1 Tax=Bacillus TaxID=1386 RepID=UPI002A50127C|nr:AMP-binding protein [Bacillus pseudomycoides]
MIEINENKIPLAIYQPKFDSNYQGVKTLTDMFLKASMDRKKGITYIQKDGNKLFCSYQELLEESKCILNGLYKLGLGPSKKAILLVNEIEIFVPLFWACILGGITPIPLKEPNEYHKKNADILKLLNCWELFGKPVILAEQEAKEKLNDLFSEGEHKDFLATSIAELRSNLPTEDLYKATQEDVALYLLTSGTTGKPKAAEYKHSNVCFNIISSVNVIQATKNEVIMNWMPLYHGASLFNQHILGVYLGCNQVLTSIEFFLDKPSNWLEWIDKCRVSITWAPPFAFTLLNECSQDFEDKNWDFSCVRYIFSGGQSIIYEKIQAFFSLMDKYDLKIDCFCPQYGMTEACGSITFGDSQWIWDYVEVDSSLGTIEHKNLNYPGVKCLTNLGRSLPGLQIRIVDKNDQLVNEKKIGRIQLKGPMIIDGYYSNLEENLKTFTSDGWFKTGDMGFLYQGRLTLTGREKDILIINAKNYYNYEVESILEEVYGIEPTYLAVGGVQNHIEENDQLIVFFTPMHFELEFSCYVIEDIKKHITRYLGIHPTHVIPIQKGEFRKTVTGKVQRLGMIDDFQKGKFDSILNEISEYALKFTDDSYCNELITIDYLSKEDVPRAKMYIELKEFLKKQSIDNFFIQFKQKVNAINKIDDALENHSDGMLFKLKKVWEKVLNTNEIGLEDHFFQKGGDSLKAFQLVTALNKEHGIIIGISDIFQHPTLESLSMFVNQKRKVEALQEVHPVPQLSKEKFYPLSPSQKSQWFVYKTNPNSPVYTTSVTLKFDGKLSVDILQKSIQAVIERHEALRVRFCLIDNEVRQWIDTFIIELPTFDLSNLPPEEKGQVIKEHIENEINTPFCLESEKLMRVKLLKCKEREHILVVSIHHIVVDGWSVEVLINEILANYKSFCQHEPSDLEPLPIKYIDYILWQNYFINENKEGFRRQLQYWLKNLSGTLPILAFPTDYPRHSRITYDGRTIEKVVESDLTLNLLRAAQNYRVTPYVLLLSLYGFLISNYTNQTEVIVGTVMSNRTPNTENLIGYLANSIALRLDLSDESTLEGLVEKVKQVVLQAQEHQQIPLELLIKEIKEKDPSYTPIFQTVFNYQNKFDYKYQTDDLDIELSLESNFTSKYDLLLHVYEEKEIYRLKLEYNTTLFNEDTMQNFMQQYYNLLENVALYIN